MNPDKQAASSRKEPLGVRIAQYLIPVTFSVAMIGIIIWILSLIRLSRKLEDIPSASVGISIVAIPVFILLLSVFWYVYLSIMRNQDEESDPGPPTSSRRKEGRGEA